MLNNYLYDFLSHADYKDKNYIEILRLPEGLLHVSRRPCRMRYVAVSTEILPYIGGKKRKTRFLFQYLRVKCYLRMIRNRC